VPTVQGFHEQQVEHKLESARSAPPPNPPISESATAVSPSASPTTDVDVDKDLPAKPSPNATDDHDAHAFLQDHRTVKTNKETKNETKQEVIEKATAHKVKPIHRLKKNQAEWTVRDPVTGLDVIIHDADFSRYDSAALDPSHPKPGPSTSPPNGETTSAKHQAPNPVQPTNVSFQPYPPDISTESLKSFLNHLDKLGYIVAAGLALVWVLTAFRQGILAFSFRTSVISAIAFGGLSFIGITRRNLEKELERVILLYELD